jgi:hypothetical protein
MNKIRLTKKELKEITRLIKKGKSLNSIGKLTDKSKTTIYYHFRKIKGRTFYPIKVNTQNEELVGEFIGLFAGDGCADKTEICQYRTYLCFNITEEVFVKDLIENVLINLFGKKPMIFKPENKLNLCYYSKNIHKLIDTYLVWNKDSRKTHSIRLRKKNYSNKFIIGFIRGCLDSDGYLSDKKITFASSSPYLIEDIKKFLEHLNIQHSYHIYKEKRTNRVDMHHINIRKKDRNRFLNLIKPRETKNIDASAGIRISETTH